MTLAVYSERKATIQTNITNYCYKHSSFTSRERLQLEKMEEASLRRRREAEQKEELEETPSERPYYVVKTS